MSFRLHVGLGREGLISGAGESLWRFGCLSDYHGAFFRCMISLRACSVAPFQNAVLLRRI